MRITRIAVTVVLLTGCASLPLSSPLSESERGVLLTVHSTSRGAFVSGCAAAPPSDRIPDCRYLVREVTDILAETRLFKTVSSSQASEGDLLVEIVPYERRPYWTTPGHNPAFTLLAIVIPFWWSEPFGYHFTVRDTRTGVSAEVNTTRSGTVVMWSLASLLNLSKSRGLDEDRTLELERIKMQLAPVLVKQAAQPTAAADGHAYGETAAASACLPSRRFVLAQRG